jgi:hypothetical protein
VDNYAKVKVTKRVYFWYMSEESVALVKKFLLWTIVVIVALAVSGGAAAYLGVFNPKEEFDNYIPVVKSEPEKRAEALQTYIEQHPELKPAAQTTSDAQYEADRKRAAEEEARIKAAQSESTNTQSAAERQAALDEYQKSLNQ